MCYNKSKDIVLRVIAAGLAPDSCSVVRVMTPHPDTALPSTSILDALKKMHGKFKTIDKSDDFFTQIFLLSDGHYLNLPVLDEDRNIVGLIDVLRLTYATLEQVSNYSKKECELLLDQFIIYRSIALKETRETVANSGTVSPELINSRTNLSFPIHSHKPPTLTCSSLLPRNMNITVFLHNLCLVMHPLSLASATLNSRLLIPSLLFTTAIIIPPSVLMPIPTAISFHSSFITITKPIDSVMIPPTFKAYWKSFSKRS